MRQDIINRTAALCGVKLSVREITHNQGVISIGVRGSAGAVQRAFLSRYFGGADLFIYEI